MLCPSSLWSVFTCGQVPTNPTIKVSIRELICYLARLTADWQRYLFTSHSHTVHQVSDSHRWIPVTVVFASAVKVLDRWFNLRTLVNWSFAISQSVCEHILVFSLCLSVSCCLYLALALSVRLYFSFTSRPSIVWRESWLLLSRKFAEPNIIIVNCRVRVRKRENERTRDRERTGAPCVDVGDNHSLFRSQKDDPCTHTVM